MKAAIVGATGIVGQQFIVALHKHPWFEISALVASERSAGKRYANAIRSESTGALGWYCDEEMPDEVGGMKVTSSSSIRPSNYDVIFTGVEADVAKVLEPKYAEKTAVVSTASAFRYEEDVPVLVPGVNNAHVRLLEVQRKKRGWKGFITPIPNCTATGLAITLKPIYDRFGINFVIMTSMQAVSGAGRNPGVLSLDVIDNVIPYIPREEEKVQRETRKILGKLSGSSVEPADFNVSSTCTRVNVKDGHTESATVSTKKSCDVEDVKMAMKKWSGEISKLGLLSAPKEMIVLHDDPMRPQPRLDRNLYDGMATSVGRLRRDDAVPNGIKYVLVSHNTKMGAAKGAVLVAELLKKEGYL